MEYDFPEAWPLPDEYLLELGRISVIFGSLEASVNVAISKLAGYEETLDWRSAVTTAHANFRQRVDILETLCYELSAEYPNLSSYKGVMNQIKRVQSDRNRYIHSQLTLDPTDNKVKASSLAARGKMKPKVDEVPLSDLRQVSADIHSAMLELHALVTGKRYAPVWERE